MRRRLSGRARPREEALREYQKLNADRRERIPTALWPFFAPDADTFYRWRTQLDCGCISEALTRGETDLPVDRQWREPGHRGVLPKGQVICWHDDDPPAPYQDVGEWGERRERTFPADPVKPPDGIDPKIWSVLRHDEPHSSAFWSVTLSCGHHTEVCVSDMAWRPEDGWRHVKPERVQQMTAEFEDLWASDPPGQDERERRHYQRMLAQGWPSPAPEELCYTCPHVRLIVAYQHAGWLVPPKPEPKRPAPPSRASLTRRLQQVEREAEQLRSQLDRLPR